MRESETVYGSGRLAVLGGDKRELLIARWFSEKGYDVSLYGTRPSEFEDLRVCATAGDAVDGASVIVTPMPGIANEDQLYSPHAPAAIVVDADLLGRAADGAAFFAGHSTSRMRSAGESKGIRWFPMGDDDYVQVQHAIPTAEAALAIAINETSETVLGSRCLVLGYGRIGSILAADLRGIGAKVTVAARRKEARARAEGAGHDAIATTQAEIVAFTDTADLVFVTTPARLFTEAALSHCQPHALVIDLASPPGGVDHDEAKRQGVRAIWARGQADGAAAHAARAQYQFMLDALDSTFSALDQG
jgi:dipicolinate synthase subunit A